MLQSALGLLGDVDLALPQPLDQIVRREVDQFDRVGAVEHRIRHGLAHPHMGDLGDDVVEAFDVLDVDGGVDVDAARQQFLDIEIALGMAAAGDVGMGEFVDQGNLRMPRDHGIEVHLLKHLILVFDPPARNDFQPPQQRFGLGPSVGLDEAHDDVGASFQLGVRALQHFVGLADAGGGADENLQPAGAVVLPPGRFQERLRRGSLFGIATRLDHATNIMRAMGSA